MEVREEEWVLLAQLREQFLAPTGGPSRDYWNNTRLCELYDATFAQRIAWKWRAVLGELARRGRMPEGARVLDWGCGSGVAAREFCCAPRPAGAQQDWRMHLWDRSAAARAFAALKLGEVAPRATILTELPAQGDALDILLVSHVLGELDSAARDELMGWVKRARTVVWVEPGDRALSRGLMDVRDRLVSEGRIVLGPCTHSAGCGLNRPGRERDWCHSFAAPAPEVFTRADWREFSRRLRIDMRSVPYAYFALGERPAQPAHPGQIRVLGRPRLEKGQAKIDACDETGVRVLRVLERDAKSIVKEFADPTKLARTYSVTTDADRVRTIE